MAHTYDTFIYNIYMELIKDKTFGGERPLFGIDHTSLECITISDGESGIKC